MRLGSGLDDAPAGPGRDQHVTASGAKMRFNTHFPVTAFGRVAIHDVAEVQAFFEAWRDTPDRDRHGILGLLMGERVRRYSKDDTDRDLVQPAAAGRLSGSETS